MRGRLARGQWDVVISFALTSSKWTLDIATKLIKATIRVHNAEAVDVEAANIFVVNHFTRIETLLIPYLLHKHLGKVIWSLAAAELFKGKVGSYLRSTGAISTRDPDREKTMVRELLLGEHPWLIFPEGAMIKDKKVVGQHGEYRVYNQGRRRRPPHRGAAVLGLLSEFYRHKLACLEERADHEALGKAMARLGLESLDGVCGRRTFIVPMNVTYFPIRSHDNVMLRVTQALAKDLGERAIEELSLEGTVLSEDTDIDIVLGNPIDVRAYLEEPSFAPLLACGVHDLELLEQDPKSLFCDAARRLMLRYMQDIYYLTTINSDHLLAGLLRRQRTGHFGEWTLRQRFGACVRELERLGYRPLHGRLARIGQRVLSEEPCPEYDGLLELAIAEGLVAREPGGFRAAHPDKRKTYDFHKVRSRAATYVIANEIEPVPVVMRVVRQMARANPERLSRSIVDSLVREDLDRFEHDYETCYDENLSRNREVGAPFLLRPRRMKAGVVLAHGYLAAPMEVRALAERLYAGGYGVYGVRLSGHGTSPEDLAQATWEEWYDAFDRGFAILRGMTDEIVLGGFSAGGALALLAAANKGARVRAVFAINAPLYLRNQMSRFVPPLVKVTAFLKKIHWARTEWEYIENQPENPAINYTLNPLHGVEQLRLLMTKTRGKLSEIASPTLIIQGSQDPVVAPESGPDIFAQIGTSRKRLIVFERNHHGIVNGAHSEEVFDAIRQFLDQSRETKMALPNARRASSSSRKSSQRASGKRNA